jgi:hypothetical protein
MNLNPYQSPDEHEPPAPVYPWVPEREPWYRRYPLSSFLGLAVAVAVTVALWSAVLVLDQFRGSHELVLSILASVIYVAISPALFAIMWVFRTGGVTSTLIAFVMWCHLGMLLGTFLVIGSGGYEGFEQMIPLAQGVPCISLPIAILHGTIAGSRRGRAF